MQLKNKLYFIVSLSQQKRTSKYIKVLINKIYKNTKLRKCLISADNIGPPINRSGATINVQNVYTLTLK